MIVIDENSEVLKWIESLETNQIGAKRLDIGTFEVAMGVQSELIIIENDVFKKLTQDQRDKLASCSAVMIYNPAVAKVENPTANIMGIINSSLDQKVLIHQIVNLEEFIKTNGLLKSQLISLNMEVNDLLDGVETQLLRIKHSYEKNAPKRLEEFPGFKIYSKYAAGSNMGGEFFDLFHKNNKIFMMISSTSSYLASSSILQLFTDLKNKETISLEDEEEFAKNVKKNVAALGQSKKKKVTAQLMTCVLNMNTMKLRGHMFGNFKILSSNIKHNFESSSSLEMNYNDGKFSRDIQRGERFMLCSPGFIMNWQSLKPKFLVEELITDKKIKVLDVLDEVYYQLKKESSGGFLKSDASSIILEVQDNVMLEI